MNTRRTRELALSALIASLYVILVYLLPSVSFYVVQVRVADCLILLSFIYGKPAIIGVTLGCFIANMLAPWGNYFFIAIDMILGSLANLIASYAVYKLSLIKKFSLKVRIIIAGIVASAIIAVIVGTYLPIILEKAFGVTIPLWFSWLSIFAGEFVAICLLGTVLVAALYKYAKH